jgi:hypothetical protein
MENAFSADLQFQSKLKALLSAANNGKNFKRWPFHLNLSKSAGCTFPSASLGVITISQWLKVAAATRPE